MSREKRLFWACIAVLAASVPAIRALPWGGFWGLDLQNLHAFHHCAANNDPYLASGFLCQDASARPMVYPPLLYWSFVWLRPLTMSQAIWIWSFFTFVIFGLTVERWAGRAERDWRYLAIALLLAIQVPLAFAIERGNNDAVVLLVWGFLPALFARKKWFVAGVMMGLAGMAKVYPLVPAALVSAGALFQSGSKKIAPRMTVSSSARLAGGCLFTVTAAYFIFGEESLRYFTDVLPGWSRTVLVIPGMSHSIPALFPEPFWLMHLIQFSLLVPWAVTVALDLKRDPELILAGVLAMSTYFSGVSWDYNLLTAFPLLLVLTSRACRGTQAAWPVLLVGLVAVIGNRRFFMLDGHAILARAQVILQVAWLIWVSLRTRSLPDPA